MRIIIFIIVIFLFFVLYILFGNNLVVFGLFLLIFILLIKILKMDEGMVVGVVFLIYFLISININVFWIINEVKLIVIGIGVVMFFNFYIVLLEDEFEKNKKRIEDCYRVLLFDMVVILVIYVILVYE